MSGFDTGIVEVTKLLVEKRALKLKSTFFIPRLDSVSHHRSYALFSFFLLVAVNDISVRDFLHIQSLTIPNLYFVIFSGQK